VSLGTGWICAAGLVVTNRHVVAGGQTYTIVFSRERQVPATLVASDVANDLALLRIDGSQTPPGLPFAGAPAAIGQKVFTIGFPHADLLGIEPKLTDGTISSVSGMQDDPRTVQISVPVQPGNSGGPLLNLRGEVVGVVTSKLNAIEVFRYSGDVPQNVNFAVKVGYVEALLATAGLVRQGPVVPAAEGDLEDVARRVRGAVVMVLVQP
jgi:S1-C subfamily serine protease